MFKNKRHREASQRVAPCFVCSATTKQCSPVPTLPPAFPNLSSCPWVVHISSLASPFPILFLNSPCLFCTYQLCSLFPVPFPPFCPSPLPTDNPPHDLNICDFVPVLVVCLVSFICLFVCFLGSVVDSCELSFYCS